MKKKSINKLMLVVALLFLGIASTDAIAADIPSSTVCTDNPSICKNGKVCLPVNNGTGMKTCQNPPATTTPSATSPTSSSSCTPAKPGFACIDTSAFPNATGCVTNLCPGQANKIKCCQIPATSGGGSPATGTNQTGGTSFVNPLRFNTVDQFLSQIMGALQKIIVTLSLLAIVYGAVLYVISIGDSKQTGKAKDAITAALVGLAIGLAAPSFLKEISSILGWGTTDTRLTGALSLSQIAINVLNFLLGTLGILSLVMLVLGGVMYVSSGGDKGRVDTGKNIFKFALLGVVLAMSSMVLVTQVAKFFITTPEPSMYNQTGAPMYFDP